MRLPQILVNLTEGGIMKKLLTVIVMGFVVIGFSAVGSDAGVKIIKPNQLEPTYKTSEYYRTPDTIWAAGTSPVHFTAEIKLPIGKTVKKIIYYHVGYGTPFTAAFLYRAKMGEPFEEMASVGTNDVTDGTIIPVEDNVIDFAKIKSGYTYWVYVISSDPTSQIHGVKIFYK